MLIDIKTENFYEGNKLVTIEYCLYINGKREGYIGIDVTHHQNFVTVSQVNNRYRGRGFGKMLYLTALESHYKISTRYHRSSKHAQYVWNSLIKTYAFRTNFFTDTLTVYNRRK